MPTSTQPQQPAKPAPPRTQRQLVAASLIACPGGYGRPRNGHGSSR